MTLEEAKRKAKKYIREYSNNGTIISDSQNSDYLLSMNDFADTAQKEVARYKKIPATFSVSRNSIPNQLGINAGFNVLQHLPDKQEEIIEATGSQSYYFEVDSQCTVYIEENNGEWVNLATINVPSTVKQYTAFKGLITPSNTSNKVRLRFSCTYPYNSKNRALYAYAFPTINDVPDYRPYVKITMPADFMELDNIIFEHDDRQYEPYTNYYWENKKTLVVNYYLVGSFDIHYWRYPMTIDDTTLDSYEFEVDSEAAEIIPFYMGGKVMLGENQTIATTLLNEYEGKLQRLATGDETAPNNVQSVYSL